MSDSIVICFPFSPASQFIGSHALANQYDVLLWMPTEADRKWGEPILLDLQILAARAGMNKVAKAQSKDFSDPTIKVVYFPTLGECFQNHNLTITQPQNNLTQLS